MTAGRDVWWDEPWPPAGSLEPVEVDSETPYLLAYTSGTTGRPKGALHVQGGFLVSIAREAAYQADLRAGDRVLFPPTWAGSWARGRWSAPWRAARRSSSWRARRTGPHDRLWRLVDEERVTMLGVSPDARARPHPARRPAADLSSLRTVVTTGEPWNRGPVRLAGRARVREGRIPIVNCSGGTEVGACFLSVTTIAPTKSCSLGFPALGEDVDVFDDDGRPVRGEVGELVCKRPWPGMTRGIWGDPERYLDTYWRRFPGVWTHGDWASIDEDGYWFLHGRSDDTLNIAGKRIGPAELESAAVGHPSVAEAAAIGVPHDVKGEVAWLYCVLVPGADASATGRRRCRRPRARQGFRARPGRLRVALPKTRSAKVVRRAVRARALGQDPGDLSTLENPEALEEIERVA